MKKIFAGLFLLLGTVTAQSQTVEEILGKYEAAVGGREKLEAIRYLEVTGSVKLAVMGNNIEMPLTLVREKGKLFRRQLGGIMGMGDTFTMLTDTSGCTFIPAQRNFGGGGGFDRGGGGGFGGGGPQTTGEPTISRFKPEEITAEQYELDCAGAFGELVNFASKGHTAQLVGTDKISKVPCYKIKMTLKTGQVVTYYIDQQTFLVKQVEAVGDMALNLTGFGPMMKAYGSRIGKDQKATLQIKEYKEFKGIQYPVKSILSFGPVESEVNNFNVAINEGLDEKWYHVK